MGHEFIELHNTAAAIECYRQAVELCTDDYRAWYGLGQSYEILRLYQYALYYYRKAANLRPNDGRMWCAIGSCLCSAGSTNQLRAQAIVSYKNAVECGDREGIAVHELAKLYKEMGSTREAVRCFEMFVVSHCVNSEDTGGTNSAVSMQLSTGTPTFVRGLSANSSAVSSAVLSGRKSPHAILGTPTSGSHGGARSPSPRSFGFMRHGMRVLGGAPFSSDRSEALSEELDNSAADMHMPSPAMATMPQHHLHATKKDVASWIRPELIPVINADCAEAIVFLASYYSGEGSVSQAQAYCNLLLDYNGPEGDQARSLLRLLRQRGCA